MQNDTESVVTIDADGDDPFITLEDATRIIPGRPSRWALYRWAMHGVTRKGRPVKLRTIKVGARHLTRREWVEQFIRESSDSAAPVAAQAMTPARRRRQAESAMQQLAAIGAR